MSGATLTAGASQPGDFVGTAWRTQALASFIIDVARGRSDLDRATFRIPDDLDPDQVLEAAILPSRSPLHRWKDGATSQEQDLPVLFRAGDYLEMVKRLDD